MFGIPEKLLNFRAYKGGSEYLGLANVDLPQMQAVTTSIKGSGISGEVDSVVTGHFQSMSVKYQFRTPTPAGLDLTAPTTHELEFRGSIDVSDPLTGLRDKSSIKVWVKGTPKSSGLGKLDPGSTMDSEIELEVLAIGVWIDGKECVYLDKFNYICRIGGIDYLADARIAEGIGD